MKYLLRFVFVTLFSALPASAHDESTATATVHQPVVLAAFPTKPEQFQNDVRPFVERIIARYGAEEWNTAVLVHELHRHLGTFSILGAKMGLRARELLGASLDDLHVESQAGLKPPLSCFNDGLQVATGASLGRGTISVVTTTTPAPEAVFVFGNKRLCLRVKPAVFKRLQNSMQKITGDMNSPEARHAALEAWAELDRREIFEEPTEAKP
jgi:pyrimidine-specific ribonucleoside hydrolase